MTHSNEIRKHPSSYRDPSGFVFSQGNIFYRQVNKSYRQDFELLVQSGLYEELTVAGLLITHEILDENKTGDADWFTTLLPEQLAFISYPYEWSFTMLRDAALLTLEIMQKAMAKGMILKDATPYNIQLHNGRMVFIDTLSFQNYDASQPWSAYRQYCENFLAPLALMHYAAKPLSPLLVAYPEGIPLHIASALLPWKTRWNLHVQLHTHLNGRISKNREGNNKPPSFSKDKLGNIVSSLRSAVNSFALDYKGTWWNYYEEAGERADYLVNKKSIVSTWIKDKRYQRAIDAGANDGTFSNLLKQEGIFVISADSDHFAIDKLYKKCGKETNSVHPLIVDLTNPSAGLGVNNNERLPLFNRVQADFVLALAVLHHLCIGRNIPFESVAQLFLRLGLDLIIEFVPKSDEKIAQMLNGKRDVYDWYTEENFKIVFSKCYTIKEWATIAGSNRNLYFMQPHEK